MTTLAISKRPSRMPATIAPMLATSSGALPADQENYSFEFKWDGIRAILRCDGKNLKIHSRNQLDITRRYPELHALSEALENRAVILDGEIVALDENDQPSFPLLMKRMHAEGAAIERLVHEVPIYFVLFDLLYLDGRSIMNRPLIERREMLTNLTLVGQNWRVSPALIGEGKAMKETALRHRLEGIVAKRLDSVYQPGRRTPDWLKIKMIMRQEFVVGGWTSGHDGSREIGALQVGYYDPRQPGKLHYAGAVGTGFSGDELARVTKQLKKMETPKNPFVGELPRRKFHFVKPKMVVEVEYRRWPRTGHLQQASYKGTRVDKRAGDVVKEDPSCSI